MTVSTTGGISGDQRAMRPAGRIGLVTALLAASLSASCGSQGSMPKSTGSGGQGGTSVGGMGGRAGVTSSGGSTGAGGTTATGGAATGGAATGGANTASAGVTGAAGAGGRAGAAGGSSGSAGHTAGTSGAAGNGMGGGAGGHAGATGVGAGCVQTIWSVDALLTDGSLFDGYAKMTVLDDATGKPLMGITSLQDNAATGAACAALTDGTVKCWLTLGGRESVGQLGNGSTAVTTTTFRATPVVVAGGAPLTNIREMARGTFGGGSCALTNDGRVYCWGDLTWIAGDGATPLHTGTAQLLTVDGTNPLTGVVQIAVGKRQGCVLRDGPTAQSAKEVWCWGYAHYAELGQGDTVNLAHPTKVPGLTRPSAMAVAAAYILNGQADFIDATICVVDGGAVRCWGSNAEGAAGNKNAGSSPSMVVTPTAVIDGNGMAIDGIVDIQNGFGSFSALRSDGSLWIWGHEASNYAKPFATDVVAIGYALDSGMLGPFYLSSDGTFYNRTRPITLPCPPP